MTGSQMLGLYRTLLSEVSSASAKLIAVSKGQPFEKIRELYLAGQRDFGENYVQELLEKVEFAKLAGCEGIRWHFLGHLQTNKVKQLIPHVYLIHSVDSARLGAEISRRSAVAGNRSRVLIEVSVDGEQSKSGVTEAELPGLLVEVGSLPGVEIHGLMCIPSREGGLTGSSFQKLRALRDIHRQQLGAGELSMGMSDDYRVALANGTNWVRVGTALFGPRNA